MEDITEDGCTLKWDPPKEMGGSPLMNYIVEKMEDGTGKWEKVSATIKNPLSTIAHYIKIDIKFTSF